MSSEEGTGKIVHFIEKFAERNFISFRFGEGQKRERRNQQRPGFPFDSAIECFPCCLRRKWDGRNKVALKKEGGGMGNCNTIIIGIH